MIAAELLILRKRAATWILLGSGRLLGIFFAYVIPYALDPESDDDHAVPPARADRHADRGLPVLRRGVRADARRLRARQRVRLGHVEDAVHPGPEPFARAGGQARGARARADPVRVCLFVAGLIASLVIAGIEGAPATLPSAWLLVRALAAGWLILAVWAALGVLLGVLTRGTSIAIGLGILYALLVEGLLSQHHAFEPIAGVFLRPTATRWRGRSARQADTIAENGPGAFGGPFVAAAGGRGPGCLRHRVPGGRPVRCSCAAT